MRYFLKKTSLRLGLFIALIVSAGAIFFPRTFLLLDETTIFTDGYASQVFYVLGVLSSGGDIFSEQPLFFVHLIRTFISVVFSLLNSMGGAPLEVFVLSLFILPVVDLFVGAKRGWISFLLFFLVFLLSFRSVLVCLSVGYLLLYQLRQPKPMYLLVSFIFASLSSGAVLFCVMLVAREGIQCIWKRKAYLLYFFLSLTSLLISVQNKLVGFASGDSGYQSTVGDSTGLVAAISRNTIIVSILEGNYLRAAVYILICLLVVFFLLKSFLDEDARWYRFVFSAGVPVMFFEGLGVIALLVPLLMMIAKLEVLPDSHVNRKIREGLWK